VRWLGSKLSWSAVRREWFNPKAAGNLLRPALYTLLFFAVVMGGGYWLVGGHTELALSSFQVNALRPPWESVWALLIGNYDWGRVPVDMRNLVALNNPPPVEPLPWRWITLAFALLYLWLYTRRYDWNNPRTPVVFAAISVLWLFLYSKGWSPQFLVWILAFIALLMPGWHGLALSLGLSVLSAIESPIFFTMFGNEHWMLRGVILLRTGLLLALLLAWCGQIWPRGGVQLQRIAAGATALFLLLTVGGIVWGAPRAAQAYADQRLANHRCTAAITYLRDQAGGVNERIVSDQITVWRDLYPWLHDAYTIHIVDGYDPHDRPWDEVIAERLAAYVGHEEFWWVTDITQPSDAGLYFVQPAVQMLSSATLGDCQVARVIEPAATPLAVAAVDGGPITLRALAHSPAKVGAALTLVLYWQAENPVTASYTVFVHLIDGAGQLVAQQDNLPVEGLAPTETWKPGAVIRDRYRLAIPVDAAPGQYQVRIGLYTADGRVPFTVEDDVQTDHVTVNIDIQ
jgi:hypothetical protein